MKPEAHGGDLLRMAATAGRDPASLLDFSVNVRPEGPPEFIRAALFRAMTALAAYPSPHAEEAMLAAARHHGMDASRFVFGSGSNELIHALARVLRKRGVPSVRVVEPAFSEYAIACRLAGLEAIPVWGGIIEKNQSVPKADTEKDDAVPTRDLLGALTDAPAGSAVFLANPGNPSGLFRTPDECLRLMSSRSDLLWIIDEAFVEYAGTEAEASVLQRLPKNGIALRSLTKFHAVPGVRLGYLAADAELAQAIRDELPAWSVNAFALAAAQAVFADTSDFAAQTRAENAERRADLAAALSSLPGIEVYPSAANYVLFRWPARPAICSASSSNASASPSATAPTTTGSKTAHGSVPPSAFPKTTAALPKPSPQSGKRRTGFPPPHFLPPLLHPNPTTCMEIQPRLCPNTTPFAGFPPPRSPKPRLHPNPATRIQ